jgi:hypothetical protein
MIETAGLLPDPEPADRGVKADLSWLSGAVPAGELANCGRLVDRSACASAGVRDLRRNLARLNKKASDRSEQTAVCPGAITSKWRTWWRQA